MELRQSLLARRGEFGAGLEAGAADAALARHLIAVLATLMPACLGLYWPVRAEFNAAGAVVGDDLARDWPVALPFARRAPREMHYRSWNRLPPGMHDECGIPSGDGAAVVPDVVLAPCLGFTADGYRLGYGGGYFDRWLAAHPHATTVGVAWAMSRLEPGVFVPQPHDRPLTLVVTELGVV